MRSIAQIQAIVFVLNKMEHKSGQKHTILSVGFYINKIKYHIRSMAKLKLFHFIASVVPTDRTVRIIFR